MESTQTIISPETEKSCDFMEKVREICRVSYRKRRQFDYFRTRDLLAINSLLLQDNTGVGALRNNFSILIVLDDDFHLGLQI